MEMLNFRSERPDEEDSIRAVVEEAFVGEPVVGQLVGALRCSPDWVGEPLGFRRPSLRIPEPAFQVLRLDSWEPWMTGTLVYSRIFWDLDCVGLREG